MDDALGTSDLAVFEAALAVARDRGEDVGEERVRAALEHRAPEIRLEAVLHVLRSWDGERPLSAALRAALGTDAPLGTASAGVSARLARDLAHRAAGKAVASTFDWKALAASNSPQVEALVSLASTQRLLTDRERQGAREAFPHLGSNRRPTPPAAGSAAPLTQALEVYPQGFVAGVLSATRCDIGKARRQGLGLGAGLLTLRRDGRAARLSPVDTGVVQDACVAATRILLMTHVAETPLPAENQRRVVVAPFDPDYVTCKESPPDYRPLSYASASSYLDPPKKTRHVNPIYPPGALRDRVQGVVVVEALIGTTGCVREASVAQGIDSRLDLAALRAVLGWRFTPTLIDGTPTPVTMQVTVQFTAQ